MISVSDRLSQKPGPDLEIMHMIWTRPDNPRAEVLFKGRFPKRQQITIVSNYGPEGNREGHARYQNM